MFTDWWTHAFHITDKVVLNGSTHLNYIWEWSTHYCCLSAMFTPLHSSTNQGLFDKKIWWCRAPQLLSETEVRIALLCQLCSIRYTAVQITNCFEKHLCNQSSHHNNEKYRRFLATRKKPSHAATKLTVRKNEWNTKEDTGKSLKNALHVL